MVGSVSWNFGPVVDFSLTTAGNYERAVESSNSAAAITSVLYPNDHTCVLLTFFMICELNDIL